MATLAPIGEAVPGVAQEAEVTPLELVQAATLPVEMEAEALLVGVEMGVCSLTRPDLVAARPIGIA